MVGVLDFWTLRKKIEEEMEWRNDLIVGGIGMLGVSGGMEGKWWIESGVMKLVVS